jgi:hypothetical protein
VGEHEEVEGNLLVCSVGARMAGVGLPACEQELRRDAGNGWQWYGEGGSVGKPGRTSRSRATHLCLGLGRGGAESGARR